VNSSVLNFNLIFSGLPDVPQKHPVGLIRSFAFKGVKKWGNPLVSFIIPAGKKS
jgi:hypothetical protein